MSRAWEPPRWWRRRGYLIAIGTFLLVMSGGRLVGAVFVGHAEDARRAIALLTRRSRDAVGDGRALVG